MSQVGPSTARPDIPHRSEGDSSPPGEWSVVGSCIEKWEKESNLRTAARLALVTGFLVSLLAGPAQAGPCGALGDVCYEILHRPMNQLCNGWEICP